MQFSEVRRQCQQLGLPVAAVREVYRELRGRQREERAWEWTIRRRSWELQTPAGCHGFWRHGWHVRYRRAFQEGDYDEISGFDLCAQAMATEFPELGRDDNADEALFAILRRPHNRLPSAAETWAEALAIVAENPDDWTPAQTPEFAFGANAF